MIQKTSFRSALALAWICAASKWRLVGGLALIMTVCSFAWGYWTAKATVILSLKSSKGAMDEQQDLARLLQSDTFYNQVAGSSVLGLTGAEISSLINIETSLGTDTIRVEVRGETSKKANSLAESIAASATRAIEQWRARDGKQASVLFDAELESAEEALENSTRELIAAQRDDAGSLGSDNDVAGYFQRQTELGLKSAENKRALEAVEAQLTSLQQEIAAHNPALLSAQQALDSALLRYTEDHPKIQELKQTLAAIEVRVRAQKAVDPGIALAGTSVAQNLYSKSLELRNQQAALMSAGKELQNASESLSKKIETLPERQRALGRLKSEYELCKKTREGLLQRRLETRAASQGATLASFIAAAPVGRVPAKVARGLVFGAIAAALACFLGGLFILGEAAASPRLRSVAALEQTANLPLLGDLGDLDKMSLQDRKSWAFFTFARLRERLGQSKNSALVCGFTSSGFGEGKSTWVNLLAEAATRQGYPVLVISAGLSDIRATAPMLGVESAESGNSSEAILLPSRFPQVPKLPAGRLTVPISALGWVWSMEGRSHWNEAVRHLDGLENQIVLVDLPPASQPETHLLAKSLPNVIWVCARGVASAPETRAQLDSLSDLGAKVVGVVMNK